MSLNSKKRHAGEDVAAPKGSKKAKKAADPKPADPKPADPKPADPKPSEGKKVAPKKSSHDAPRPVKSSSSLLKEESKAFPRGGGGAITPFERRQQHIKADQDALLEESRPQKKQKSSFAKPNDQKPVNAKANGSKRAGDEKSKTKPQQPRHSFPQDGLTYKDIAVGDLMDGRVTRVEEYAVFVQLRSEIAGRIALTELSDDYNKANPREFRRNQIIKVRVVAVDAPNKRVNLTCRTSKTLSSTAPVKDPLFSDLSQLQVGQIVRGFVKNVADVGLFIILSYKITAFVRVSELSDKFIDDWRSHFEVDQLVRGRIISVGDSPNQVQMSLKTSALSSDFKIQRNFHDFKVGDIVPGTVHNVTDFGAFIRIDDTKNVSGLCHRSEIAQTKVEDARTLYNVGDRVKAKILTLKPAEKKISFGLKASYFKDDADSDEDMEDDMEADKDEGVDLALDNSDVLASLNKLTGAVESDDEDMENVDGLEAGSDDESEEVNGDAINDDSDDGLDAGGFDWSNAPLKSNASAKTSTSAEEEPVKKRKSQKGKIVEDHTGDLDINNPKTTSDFELLLLGTPNDAGIWARYIALKASEDDIEGARGIAARAIRTISVTETSQKLEVWTIWFNLELQFGSEASVEDVFKQSCEVMDRANIHERFISCCTDVAKQKARDYSQRSDSEKLVNRALLAFDAMKKFPECSKGPDFWVDYGRFLFNVKEDVEAARAMPNRAQQSVVDQKYPDLIKGFALLEFNCRNGDPERGRTIFEQLLEIYTKRWDFWEVYLAAEAKQKAWDNMRQLYERITTKEITTKLKKKNVRRAFDEWERFEREHGGEKKLNKVRARRQEYEERLADKAKEAEDAD